MSCVCGEKLGNILIGHQILVATDVMNANALSELRSFGYSMASGVDVDGNMYNGREGLGRRVARVQWYGRTGEEGGTCTMVGKD